MKSHINWDIYRPVLHKKHTWCFKFKLIKTEIKLKMQILSHTSHISRVQQADVACGYDTGQHSTNFCSTVLSGTINSPVSSSWVLLPNIPQTSPFPEHYFVAGNQGETWRARSLLTGDRTHVPCVRSRESWPPGKSLQSISDLLVVTIWWLLRVREYAFLVGGVWHWSLWQPPGVKEMYSLCVCVCVCVCVCLRQRKDFGILFWLLRNLFISSKSSNLLA